MYVPNLYTTHYLNKNEINVIVLYHNKRGTNVKVAFSPLYHNNMLNVNIYIKKKIKQLIH